MILQNGVFFLKIIAEEYTVIMSPQKTKSDSILHGYLILKVRSRLYVLGPTSLGKKNY